MPQSHVVKRGSQFYFRIAVPLSLTKLVGKREIKASLRTSDAMSAKMRGRVLSNGLELLFPELRSMAHVSNDVIVNRAKDYFTAQLSKSLELALLLPTDPLIDIDFEVTGTEQLATKMREALKQYPVHVMTRKFLGDMMRKLSVTESRNRGQFRGTFSRRNPSVASANWAQVA